MGWGGVTSQITTTLNVHFYLVSDLAAKDCDVLLIFVSWLEDKVE